MLLLFRNVSEQNYKRLGQDLRAARKARGWSLRQLAGFLGCNHQRIILWEKGANQPNKSYQGLLTVLFAKRFDWRPDPPEPMSPRESGADMRTERRFMERAS